MWMSLMTSGVKIRDWPRMYFWLSAGARASGAAGEGWPFLLATFVSVGFFGMANSLKHQLLFGRLEIVVVPQLLAGDDLAEVVEAGGRHHVVDPELAGEPFAVACRHLRPHR